MANPTQANVTAVSATIVAQLPDAAKIKAPFLNAMVFDFLLKVKTESQSHTTFSGESDTSKLVKH